PMPMPPWPSRRSRRRAAVKAERSLPEPTPRAARARPEAVETDGGDLGRDQALAARAAGRADPRPRSAAAARAPGAAGAGTRSPGDALFGAPPRAHRLLLADPGRDRP